MCTVIQYHSHINTNKVQETCTPDLVTHFGKKKSHIYIRGLFKKYREFWIFAGFVYIYPVYLNSW